MNMHVGDIIKQGTEPVDHYSQGVALTYGGQTHYYDPNDFDFETYAQTGKVNPDDLIELRRQIVERNPEIAATYDESDLEAGVERILSVGPFAMPPNEDAQYCTVNREAEFLDEKAELFSAATALDPEYLKPIGGSEESWDAFMGAHEGDHCDKGMRNSESPDLSTDDDAYDFNTLQDEVAADRAALRALKEAGYDDITDEVRDMRALGGGVGDATHSTQLHLDNDDPVTFEHYEAARDFPERMREAYDAEWGEGGGSIKFDSGPTEFAESIREMLDRGDFDNESNPYMKDYIEGYVEAYERRVDDPEYSFSRPGYEYEHEPVYEDGLHGMGQDDAELDIEATEPYIKAAIPLENERAGIENHPIELQDAKNVLGDPETDPAILTSLQENYGAEIAELGLVNDAENAPNVDALPQVGVNTEVVYSNLPQLNPTAGY